MTVTQRFTKECGGWTVETFVDGEIRRQTWTSGNRRDADGAAAEDRAFAEAAR